MRIIKVATDDGNAYYDIVSRLKRTHLRYSSHPSWQAGATPDDLVITSKVEATAFANAVAIEDLSEDPLIMEGQLLSRLLDGSRKKILVGIDPGSRIGMAVFYCGRELGALTTDSVEKVVGSLVALEREVPHSSFFVKIGGGEPRSSIKLARTLREAMPISASIEIVDESGTSAGRRGAIGAARDKRAAARIAFRNGVQFNDSQPRRKNHA